MRSVFRADLGAALGASSSPQSRVRFFPLVVSWTRQLSMSITRPSRLLLFCCAAFAGDFAADLRRGLVTLWAAPRSTDDMPRLAFCNGFNENARYRSGSAPKWRSEVDGGAATHVARAIRAGKKEPRTHTGEREVFCLNMRIRGRAPPRRGARAPGDSTPGDTGGWAARRPAAGGPRDFFLSDGVPPPYEVGGRDVERESARAARARGLRGAR